MVGCSPLTAYFERETDTDDYNCPMDIFQNFY